MLRKCLVLAAFMTGLLVMATVDSQGQPPAGGFGGKKGKNKGGGGDFGGLGRVPGGPGGGGPGGFGGGGFGGGGFGGGFTMDPNAAWDRMAQGQDSINLNDQRFSWMRTMMERRGEQIPPNGILTRQQFVAGMQQRMNQGGFGGGQPGMGMGGQPGMNIQFGGNMRGPGDQGGGRPTVMIQGGQEMGGGPGGGRARGGLTNMDPNLLWDRIAEGRDSIDLSDPRSSGLRYLAERGGMQLPQNGVLTRQQFVSAMMQQQQQRANQGGPGGFDPRNGNMSMGGFPNSQQGGWGGNPGGWGGNPGGWGGDQGNRGNDDRRNRNRDEEEDRPVVYRYGNLPRGLPGWWDTLDTDRDGQIGLYEWRRSSNPPGSINMFVEMDLNGDGYLTASEWLRYQQLALERRSRGSDPDDPDASSFRGGPGMGMPGMGMPGMGGMGGRGQQGGGDRNAGPNGRGNQGADRQQGGNNNNRQQGGNNNGPAAGDRGGRGQQGGGNNDRTPPARGQQGNDRQQGGRSNPFTGR
jgi:hypothetical protein